MKKIGWLGLGLVGILVTYFTIGGGGDYLLPKPLESFNNESDSSAARKLNESPQHEATTNRAIAGDKLVDVIADQIAKKGASSPEVADLVSVSQGACTSYAEKAKKGVKTMGWAGEYLASACQDFDAAQYKGLRDPAPDFLSISLEGGQAATAEAALNYLKHPDSVLAALQAAMVLGESGKLPEQISLGLSEEQLARAIAAANASAVCPGQNGCVAEQVLAASTCMEASCPVHTTYETALRRDLSPAELEATTRLRDWLVSLRTQ